MGGRGPCGGSPDDPCTKWTVSVWARRINIESGQGKYGFGDWRYTWSVGCKYTEYVGFHPDGGVQCGVRNGNERVMTNLRYTDPDGVRWNHILCAVDTSHAVESERVMDTICRIGMRRYFRLSLAAVSMIWPGSYKCVTSCVDAPAPLL